MLKVKKKKLSEKQRRKMAIAVAKDVIKHIRYLEVKSSVYCVQPNLTTAPTEGEVQPNIHRLATNCQVCALGATFLSHVRLHNEFTWDKVVDADFGEGVQVDEFDMRARLRDIFTNDQMHMIECAFEGWGLLGVAYAGKFHDSRKRLKKIMENIIANNGEFIPNADLTEAEIRLAARGW